MSKAELFQQLETLSTGELDDLMERVTILQHTREGDHLTPYEREILEKRISAFEHDRNRGEPWEVVRDRIQALIKK